VGNSSQQQQQPLSTQVVSPIKSEPSLEEMMKQLMQSQANMANQIGQLATSINQMQSKGLDKLPSQTVINPQNVSAITLRSGKGLQVSEPEVESTKVDNQPRSFSISNTFVSEDFVPKRIESSTSYLVRPSITLPFPHRVVQKSKKLEETEKEIMETFRKVEVKIPLLDAIKKIPKYAKFLKDLCTHRRRLKGNEKENMGKNVSALIVKHGAEIPKKM